RPFARAEDHGCSHTCQGLFSCPHTLQKYRPDWYFIRFSAPRANAGTCRDFPSRRVRGSNTLRRSILGAIGVRRAMPTYTYECKKCGHTQDVFHGMSETRRVKCEDCGGACRKLLGTGAGLIFKGSGFYETDYKRSGNGKGGKTGEPSKSDG